MQFWAKRGLPLIIVLAVSLCPWRASADADVAQVVTITWAAPTECPPQSQLSAEIAMRLGSRSIQPLVVAVTVVSTPAGYVATIQTSDAPSRSLQSLRCDKLLHAAALVVVNLALQSPVLAEPIAAASQVALPVAIPLAPPVTLAASVAQLEVTSPLPPAAASGASVRFSLGLAGLVGFAAKSPFAIGGIGLRARGSRGHVFAETVGEFWPRFTRRSEQDNSVLRLQAWTANLRLGLQLGEDFDVWTTTGLARVKLTNVRTLAGGVPVGSQWLVGAGGGWLSRPRGGWHLRAAVELRYFVQNVVFVAVDDRVIHRQPNLQATVEFGLVRKI